MNTVYDLRVAREEDEEQARRVFYAARQHLIREVLCCGQSGPELKIRKLDPTVVAVEQEKLLGFCTVKDRVLHRLYVDPEHQGRGVGKQLLAEAEAHGARLLWVDETNYPARRLYESRGWAWDGVKDPGHFWPDLMVLRYSR